MAKSDIEVLRQSIRPTFSSGASGAGNRPKISDSSLSPGEGATALAALPELPFIRETLTSMQADLSNIKSQMAVMLAQQVALHEDIIKIINQLGYSAPKE